MKDNNKKYLIVGIGNPGSYYANTKHNLGFKVISQLSKDTGIKLVNRKFLSILGEGEIDSTRVVLAMPQTFVNRSGEAVVLLLRKYTVAIEGLIVVCDDLNLQEGQIRIRLAGSAGGHNGITSIITCLGTDKFNRVRIGIGSPPPEIPWAEYVLSPLEETKKMLEVISTASEIIRTIIIEGIDKAMNKYNR